MRRNIKNDKVIKAITIGLATMIAATSAPVGVLADDGNTGSNENSPVQDQQSQTEKQIDVAVEIIEGTPANEETNTPAEAGALELIEDADKKVDAFADSFNLTETEDNKAIQEDLTNAANYIADAEGTGVKLDENGNIDNINGEASNGAEKDLKDAQKLVAEGYDEVDKANDAMEDVKGDNQVLDTAGNINKDKDNNGKNDLVEKVKGYADSANAASDYNTAVGFQGQAQDTYDKAATELEQAKIKYQNALDAKKDADEKFDAANEKIEHAQVNSAASYKALVDAKDKLAELKKDSEEKQKELEAIQKQYYALQVQYYRKAGCNDNTQIEIKNENGETVKVNVFDENGKLNVDYAAQWIVENNNKVTNSSQPGEAAYKIGRYLMKELIVAKLKDEGVDPNTITVGGYFEDAKKQPQDAWEVNVHKNSVNGDQVISTGETIPKDYVIKKEQYYRASDNTENRGQTNRFLVTYKYKDANGEEQTATEYYNYVFKAPDHDGNDLKMEEGPIYLAQIKQNSDGTWYVDRVEGANDNYKELVNVINQYSEAEKAVQAAKDKVEKLQGQISEIQRAGKINIKGKWLSPDELLEGDYDPGMLMELGGSDPYIKLIADLKMAEKELGTAQENVDEAKRILDSIDLSRFSVSDDNDDDSTDDDSTDDDSTGDSGDGAGTVLDGGDVSVTIPGGFTLPSGFAPTGGAPAGVLGVRTGNGGEEAGGEVEDNSGITPAANFDTVNKALGAVQNKENNKKLVKVADPPTPLAALPADEEGVEMSWYWLLIIFLLGAAGKKMYDKYKERQEAKNNIQK